MIEKYSVARLSLLLLFLRHLNKNSSRAFRIRDVNLELVGQHLELVHHLGVLLPTWIRWGPNVVQRRFNVLPVRFYRDILFSAERPSDVIGRRDAFRRWFRIHARTFVEGWLDRRAVIVIQKALDLLQQLLAILLQFLVHQLFRVE